jgi:hypothetical protein
MNSFLCKHCGAEHEVYKLHDIKGKPTLSFVCEEFYQQSTDTAGAIINKKVMVELPYVGEPLAGPFRDVDTARLKKKKQSRNQLQLTLVKTTPKAV